VASLLVLLDGPARHDHQAYEHVTPYAHACFVPPDQASEGSGAGRSHAEGMLDIVWRLASPQPGRTSLLAYGIVIGAAGTGTPGSLAAGLRWAAGLNPSVVAVPCGLQADSPDVRAGTGAVVEAGARLFAASGNPFAGQRGALFPAAYPGVISVGAPAYVASYASWAASPDVVPNDMPAAAIRFGTSGACVVAAWRALRTPPAPDF
jgi:hypothetical protein